MICSSGYHTFSSPLMWGRQRSIEKNKHLLESVQSNSRKVGNALRISLSCSSVYVHINMYYQYRTVSSVTYSMSLSKCFLFITVSCMSLVLSYSGALSSSSPLTFYHQSTDPHPLSPPVL